MIPNRRKAFNDSWSEDRYRHFVSRMESDFGCPVAFHICETPAFFDARLTKDLIRSASDILNQSISKEVQEKAQHAIPEKFHVPGPEELPHFIQVDFAIVRENGSLVPRLIELQGFPSLYAFQLELGRHLLEYAGMPDLSFLPAGMTERRYLDLFRETIVSNEDPEQVILLEIHPEQQKTFVDFHLTKRLTGISIVNLTDVRKSGSGYSYKKDGKDVPIKRIYNRVIFDELERLNLQTEFDFSTVEGIQWATHPNWYFRISKYLLPLLKHESVPRCWFLNEAPVGDVNLSDFVLKPLYSFAGSGVVVNLEQSHLDAIPGNRRHEYILQEKVHYEPVLETPDDPARLEVRVMFLLKESSYECTNFLVRVSKGQMMGVDFNKNRTWVGSAGALFE